MKPKQNKPDAIPKTESEWASYRCKLSCRIGREVLDGKTKPPAGCTALEFALYNLLCAVEELAKIKSV